MGQQPPLDIWDEVRTGNKEVRQCRVATVKVEMGGRFRGKKPIEEWFLVSTNFALSSQTVHQLVKLKRCKSILVLELHYTCFGIRNGQNPRLNFKDARATEHKSGLQKKKKKIKVQQHNMDIFLEERIFLNTASQRMILNSGRIA